MEKADISALLERAGITVTPNRLSVLGVLAGARRPLGLIDLDTILDTLDRSSILRVLTLLESNNLIHAVEDGRGVTKYELCNGPLHSHSESDMHIHFYCVRCRETSCMENISVPHVEIPDTFLVESVNYMLKGICPKCRKIDPCDR